MSLPSLILNFLKKNGESTVDEIYEELQDYTEKHEVTKKMSVLVNQKKITRIARAGRSKPLFKII